MKDILKIHILPDNASGNYTRCKARVIIEPRTLFLFARDYLSQSYSHEISNVSDSDGNIPSPELGPKSILVSVF